MYGPKPSPPGAVVSPTLSVAWAMPPCGLTVKTKTPRNSLTGSCGVEQMRDHKSFCTPSWCSLSGTFGFRPKACSFFLRSYMLSLVFRRFILERACSVSNKGNPVSSLTVRGGTVYQLQECLRSYHEGGCPPASDYLAHPPQGSPSDLQLLYDGFVVTVDQAATAIAIAAARAVPIHVAVFPAHVPHKDRTFRRPYGAGCKCGIPKLLHVVWDECVMRQVDLLVEAGSHE